MRTVLISSTLVAAVLLSSCLGDRLELLVPTTRRLDSSPETTGLLIIHVRMTSKDIFGLESDFYFMDATIRSRDTGEVMQDKTSNQLAVFEVPPETYELVGLHGTYDTGPPYHFTYSAHGVVGPEVEPIEVAAGRLTYVGKLIATGKGSPARGFTFTYRWDRNPAREAEALGFVEQRFKDSPWIPILRSRLDSLRQATGIAEQES